MKNFPFRQKALIIAIVISVFIVFGFVAFLSKSGQRATESKENVATTIFPLYDIVRNIAGEEIETVLLLPPGASPHTFDPTPKDVEALSQSKILFAIGHNLDNWAYKMAVSVDVNKIVTVDKYISHIQSLEAEESGVNPHYWLSVKNANLIAKQVKEELSLAFPNKAGVFEKNYQNYSNSLAVLDSELRNELKGLSRRDIAAFHAAWDYFAKDYNLKIIAAFEEFPGKEPTPEYLDDFQKKIKEDNIKVIFAEPQFSTAQLEPIAKDLEVTISVLDPIGGAAGRETYISLMKYNVNQILKILK